MVRPTTAGQLTHGKIALAMESISKEIKVVFSVFDNLPITC